MARPWLLSDAPLVHDCVIMTCCKQVFSFWNVCRFFPCRPPPNPLVTCAISLFDLCSLISSKLVLHVTSCLYVRGNVKESGIMHYLCVCLIMWQRNTNKDTTQVCDTPAYFTEAGFTGRWCSILVGLASLRTPFLPPWHGAFLPDRWPRVTDGILHAHNQPMRPAEAPARPRGQVWDQECENRGGGGREMEGKEWKKEQRVNVKRAWF